jgi:hypothetical protein
MTKNNIIPQSLTVFDALLKRDLSYLTEFECVLPEIGATPESKNWWRNLFSKAPNIRRLGLQSGSMVNDAFDSLIALEKDYTIFYSSFRPPIDSNTHDTSSMLLLNLSTIVISKCDFYICHLKRFKAMRKRYAIYVQDPVVQVSLHIDDKDLLSCTWQEVQVYYEALRNEVLAPGFLFDPRYGWGCNFNLDKFQY